MAMYMSSGDRGRDIPERSEKTLHSLALGAGN